MAMYLIGDVQGCDEPLTRLLHTLDFSPSRDRIYLLGDLVNRGPGSLAVLRLLAGLGDAACCMLGNHDIHLLAVGAGVHKQHRGDTLDAVLQAPDTPGLLDWLRHQRMAVLERGCLMMHAGVLPQWTAEQTLGLAGEVEAALRGPDLRGFLLNLYGNKPDRWSQSLEGEDRMRVIVNVLTRLRFCTADGAMDFSAKEGPGSAPPGYLPWYDVPGRKTASLTVAFGHWASLGWLARDDVLSLDTGCVWGGCLSAVRLDSDGKKELVQADCAGMRKAR